MKPPSALEYKPRRVHAATLHGMLFAFVTGLLFPQICHAQFSAFAENGAQRSIATALDRVCGTTAVGALATQCASFQGALGNGNEGLTLQQVGHEEYSETRSLGAERLERQRRAIAGRLGQRRDAQESGIGGRDEREPFLSSPPPVGFFFSPSSTSRDFDGGQREDAYDLDAWGVLAGVDRWISEQVLVGFAVQLEKHALEFDRAQRVSGGGIEGSSYGATLYGSTKWRAIQLDASAGVGVTRLSLRRRLLSQTTNYGLDSEASARTQSRSLHAHVSMSRQLELGTNTLEPWLDLAYAQTHVDGFREDGADGFRLRVSGDDVRSLQSTLGVRLSRPIGTTIGVFRPELRMSWRHEFLPAAPRVAAAFVSDTSGLRFAPDRAEVDRDHGVLGISLSWTRPHGVQPYLDYETVIGRRDVSQHVFRMGLRIEL